MKTKIFILMLAVCMACGGEGDVPRGILDERQMVALLIEVHKGQTRVDELMIERDSGLWVFEQFFNDRLSKHGVSDSVFYKSMQYYMDHPLIMDRLYEAVLDTFNLRLNRIEAQENKNESKEDSLDVAQDLSEEL